MRYEGISACSPVKLCSGPTLCEKLESYFPKHPTIYTPRGLSLAMLDRDERIERYLTDKENPAN